MLPAGRLAVALVLLAGLRVASPPALAADLAAVQAQLLLLPGTGCDVRYAPGSLDRAAHAQEWLCELTAGGSRLTRSAAALDALLLPREEWAAAGITCRYGLPCLVSRGVLALPAAGDPGTVALWTEALGALPPLTGTPLVGTPEEVASLAPADALGAFVAARELIPAAGLTAEEPWVLDLLAHLLFLDAARQGRQGRGEAVAAFWSAVRRREQRAAAPAADDSLAGELARQARLFAAAQVIAGGERRLPLKQLRRLQQRGGGRLRAADVGALWPQALAVAGE